MLPRQSVAILLLSLAAHATAEEPAEAPAQAETATTSPVERASLPARSAEQARQLARQLPDQAHWLEANGEQFLALWQPANTGKAKGVVILLPDQGQHADWPLGIAPLRTVLPDHGWNTLSLNLPDAEPAPLPEPIVMASPSPEPQLLPEPEPAPEEPEPEPVAEPEPENAAVEESAEPASEAAAPGQAATDEPPPSHAEQVAARIEAALDFAAAHNGGPVMLVGQGSGAYWALRFKTENTVAQIARLAVISPRQPLAESTRLEDLLEQTTLPVGDFYLRQGREIAWAKQRRALSQRSKHPAYHQVGLTPLPADRPTEQGMLVKRVRGWLERPL